MIKFSIIYKSIFPSVNYIRKMHFKEIRELNKIFNLLNSFNEFYDYLKALSENKKLIVKKRNDRISIIFYVEILLKQQEIVIDLFPIKKDVDLNIKEIYQELSNIKLKIDSLNGEIETVKNENKELIQKTKSLNNENTKLNEEIVILKNKNIEINNKMEVLIKEIKILKESKSENKSLKQNLNFDKSSIMEISEKNFVLSEIESKMNKTIKHIKKLYQATIDGGDPINFHKNCNNIPNTLVLIKSEGQRRFGGFTHIPWTTKGSYIKDPEMKTFVFSLDNKKIYNLKSSINAVCHQNYLGPCF